MNNQKMSTIQYLLSVLTVLIALTFQTALGQNLDTIKFDNKQSILNDRAFFNFPTYATNIKRGVDIMSADPNGNEETRIVLDMGEMRLVFFAQELFVLGDNDLLNTITKQNEPGNFKTKILSDKDSLLSILSTPTAFDSTKNAIILNSLVVRTQDNTLFQINAYINPAGYKLKDQFIKLTEDVFSTLTKGTRVNNLGARQEKHGIFLTDKAFTFDLPANYSITVDQQYDFQVFKFHKYQTAADTNWIQFIIYSGFHPSSVYGDYGLSQSDAKKINGTFLGHKIDWLYFDMSKEGFYVKEQQIQSDQLPKDQIIHLALLSNQEQSIDEMTKIAESIKLVDQ